MPFPGHNWPFDSGLTGPGGPRRFAAILKNRNNPPMPIALLTIPDRGGLTSSFAGRLQSGLSALPRLAGAALLSASLASAAPPASAQGRKLKVIRDAEIEVLLRDYAGPIFKAAGIGSRGAEIVLLQDRSFNAFVASGNRMFINTGTLLDAKTPNEVIGVIAHETGHLAGGHLQGLRNEAARSRAIGLIATLLGAGVAVAGAAAGSTSGARAGAAASTIGPGIARRTLLSYRRTQESTADSAALNYLNATGQSAKGMLVTFRRFADQALFSKQYVDPYVLSHPMPNARISQLESLAGKSRYFDKSDPAQLQLRHDLMQAKLSGFTEGPGRVQRRFARSDKSIAADYARAIVAYRTGSLRSALKRIDGLIRRSPNYPYFHELKGQALLEAGKARKAIAPLRKAVSLAPKPGLIRIMLAHALIETGDAKYLKEAIGNLKAGLAEEPLAAIGYRHLSTAYARQGRIAEAELATAQGQLIDGNVKAAQSYAKRAQAKLKRGTPSWLQADDIIAYKVPKTR
jgi:predicted Zn-dependent protease